MHFSTFYKGLKTEPMNNSFAEVTLTSLADLIPANSSPEDIEMLSASLGKVETSESLKHNLVQCVVGSLTPHDTESDKDSHNICTEPSGILHRPLSLDSVNSSPEFLYTSYLLMVAVSVSVFDNANTS